MHSITESPVVVGRPLNVNIVEQVGPAEVVVRPERLVYLAGPIAGQTYAGCTSWREWVRSRLDAGIVGVSPMRAKDAIRGHPGPLGHTYDHGPLTTDAAIVARDRFDVQRCDLVFVNLLEAGRVSVGTMVELGWADAFRKPLVVAMRAGCVHDHPFVRRLAGFVLPSLAEAVDVVHAILRP